MILFRHITVLFAFAFISSTAVQAQIIREDDPKLKRIDIDEHLGSSLPLDLPFVDQNGNDVKLDDYFHEGIPVLLALQYSDCPMLCSLVLTGLSKGIRQLGFRAGKDYRVLAVSIDPDETVERSRMAYDRYGGGMKDGSTEDAWTFFTGDQAAITTLADTLGFRYYKVEKTGQFAHPAAVYVLTEEGRISRYLYGIEFKERDLRLALLEASDGKIGNTIDRVLLYCFHYDPDSEGYVVFAGNVMKLGGAVTLVLLALILGALWKREQHKRNSEIR